MADSPPLADLLNQAGNAFSLAGRLGRAFHEEHQRQSRQIDPAGWNRHAPTFNEYCAAMLNLRVAMQNPPDGFVPVAEALLEAARIGKGIRDAMQRPDGHKWATYLDFFPHLNSVSEDGWRAVKEVTKARRLDDPFAFVDERNADDAVNAALSLLDQFPATPVGHIGFLEFVRDEGHNAAEAKRGQFERGYSSDTLASMVRGIKWAEAGQRTSMLSELPADAVEQVACVLRRELIVGTVEQIDDLLTPAVRALRDALEGADNATSSTTAKLADDTNKARPDEKHAETAKPTTPTRTSARRPPEIAFIAWRLRDLYGTTNQTQIAAKMTEKGTPATQGQVSRWLKQVADYMKAGNVLPTIPPLTCQPQSIDPEIIDMGERQDGRTPRQRDRGDTESR